MKLKKNQTILSGSNFSLQSDIVYSEFISYEEYKDKNLENNIVLYKEDGYLLYKLTHFELFENAVIFCNNFALLSLFRQLHGNREFKNIKIITHQTDQLIDEKLFSLKPDCISKWFSINVGYEHPDLIPIPLGLGNNFQSGQINPLNINDVFQLNPNLLQANVYLNFKESTNAKERENLYDYFKNKKWAYSDKPTLLKSDYEKVLKKSNFILCPWGNGIDTHRLWEALYYNKIPITKFHHTYSSLEGLPILFVDSYRDITEELLFEFIESLKSSEVDYTKLNTESWFDLINQKKEKNLNRILIKESKIYSIMFKINLNAKKNILSKLKLFRYYLKQFKKIPKKIYQPNNELK